MNTRRRLPTRITLAMSLVLMTTAWNLIRALTAIFWRDPLAAYAFVPGPVYIGLTGAAFAILGLGVLWGLWRRTAWAPRAFLIGTWAYVAWNWTDRLLLQPQDSAGWPFAAVATALLLGWSTAVALDRRNQMYFGNEDHGRESENSPSA
jgi:hypothetical protein